jgi:ABC-type cobalamin/Fe3+-siderophores transport system ATPase subunit
VSQPKAISIEADNTRVDVAGAVACEGLCFAAKGSRLVITGTPAGALAAAVCGSGSVVAGRLLLDGHDVAEAKHFGHVGVAPFDMPLPLRDSVLAFVTVSFRLAGLGRHQAAAAAHAALAELGLQAYEPRKSPTLSVPERRAVAIAQAMLPGADVLFAESPLAGLETSEARFVLEVLGRVCTRRAVVATALRTDPASPERELVLGADCVAILTPTGAGYLGDPTGLNAGARLMAVTVRGHEPEFEAAARAAGIGVSGAAPRFVLLLNEGTNADTLLQLARDTEATLLEIAPLWD